MSESRKPFHEICLKEVLRKTIDNYLETKPQNEGRLRALVYKQQIKDAKIYPIKLALLDVLRTEVTSALGTSVKLRSSVERAVYEFMDNEIIVKMKEEDRKFEDLLAILIINYLRDDDPMQAGKIRGISYLIKLLDRIERKQAIPALTYKDFIDSRPESLLGGSQKLRYKVGVFLCSYYNIPNKEWLEEQVKVQSKKSLFSIIFYTDDSCIVAMQIKLREKMKKLTALTLAERVRAKLFESESKEQVDADLLKKLICVADKKYYEKIKDTKDSFLMQVIYDLCAESSIISRPTEIVTALLQDYEVRLIHKHRHLGVSAGEGIVKKITDAANDFSTKLYSSNIDFLFNRLQDGVTDVAPSVTAKTMSVSR